MENIGFMILLQKGDNDTLHFEARKFNLVVFFRVHDYEDAMQRAEKFRASLEKSANDQIQQLRLRCVLRF